MANQIVVSAGAKVRNLSGVLTATSGVVSFLPIDVSLGIPQLDVNGKILVSQLPNSVMEYKGTWDASTNTPTLANGTGNQGDVYLCSVAGTVNFGAGAIAFFVGDQVIYSGSIWQRASGATGTVTSVAVTESGDSLNITGSPITTSGTINIGFNGTNLQYVNGAGNLTTFPILTGYVTAVSGTAPVVSSGGTTPAISMAAATGSVDGYLLATDFAIFSAKQSALTFSSPLVNTSGTISIPAATTSVNGYLASADFTTFNNKQNAITLTTTGSSGVSTLVGATLNIPDYGSALTGYVTLATTQTITGAKTFSGYTTFTSTVDITSGLTFSNSGFTLVLQPPTLSVNRTVTLPNATGTLALTSDISYPVTSVFGRTGAVVATNGDYTTAQVTEVTNLYFTDSRARLALSFVAGSGAYNNTTGVITIPTNNNQITNGAGYITGNQTITLSGDVSGSGTTAITTTIGALKVTNAMLAGSIDLTTKVTGLLPDGNISSAATWNAKQNAITLTTTGTSGAATFTSNTLNIPNYTITNAVTGTGTTNYLPKFTGTSTIGNSIVQDSGSAITITGSNYLFNLSGGGSSRIAASINNTSGNLEWGLEGSAGNQLFTGMAAYQAGIGTSNNTSLNFATNTVVRMQLNTSGNLGLGVTPSAWASGYKAFQIGNSSTEISALFSNGVNDFWAVSNAYFDGTNFKRVATGTATGYEQTNGAHKWYQVASDSAATNITFTQAMTLTASGNLLIGTTTDYTSKLVIIPSSNPTSSTGANNQISIGETSNNTGYCLKLGYINTGGGYQGSIQSIAGGSGSTLFLNASGGNVLIGTTTDGGYKLDVNGTGRFSGDLRASKLTLRDDGLENFATASDTGAISVNYFGYNTGTTYFRDFTVYNGKNAQIFKLTGSTGAATFSSSVTAGGTISASDYIQAARSSGGYLMGISNTVDADLQFTLTASGAATKYASIGGSGATNLVLVPNGGNIGIGTSSPNYTGYGAGMTVLSLATSTADKFSIIELVGNRGIGGNQNGLIAFINNNGTATVTSRITGINTTGSVLGGQLTFETKADAGSLTEAMRITSGGNIEIASGSIKTGTPSGGTAKPWKLGQDTSTLYSATRTIQVEIDGGTYYLLAVKSTDL